MRGKSLMKKILLGSLLVMAAGARAADSAATVAPAAPPPASAALDWLAGGVWTAALPPDQKGNVTKIELTVTHPETRQGLRFDSAFVIGGQRRPYTSGMYAWNAAKQKFAIFYTDSSGSLSAGDVTPAEGVFVHEFTATDRAGKVENIRVRLTHDSATTFTNEIFVEQDGAWAKIVSVKYERPG